MMSRFAFLVFGAAAAALLGCKAEVPITPPQLQETAVDAKIQNPSPVTSTKIAATQRPVTKPSPVDAKRASDAVLGYYQALVDRDYSRASGFVHPDFVDPLRGRFMETFQKGTDAQQKATLRTLGVESHAALQALTPAKFFLAFSQSPYGKGLRHLGDPAAEAHLSIKNTKCRDDIAFCMAELHIESIGPKGPQTNDFPVSAAPIDGMWLVGPPTPARAQAN